MPKMQMRAPPPKNAEGVVDIWRPFVEERAGADAVLTYYALDAARWLRRCCAPSARRSEPRPVHQPSVPGAPLNGPTTSSVIHSL